MANECTKDGFLRCVENHSMKVIKDDGVYRHIRFSQKDTNDQYFDLITWPEYLCYTGDMGTYVFSRTNDMFSFFRRGELNINRPYWSEKVESSDRDGVNEYSQDEFKRQIQEYINEDTSSETEELIYSDLLEIDFQFELEARQAVDEFNGRYGETFYDFWENDLTRFTYRFTWCCYAIVWAIQQYDENTK